MTGRSIGAHGRTVLAAAALATACVASPAAASDRGWGKAGGLVRDCLVLAALGLPAAKGDWDGALEGAGSVALAGGETWARKRAFPETRPDGSDNRSFPSGHTSASFAAAASIENRYGWKLGLPAQVAAAFVGVSRVEAHKHYWHDVVAGAAIGELTGFLVTRRHDDGVAVLPWGDAQGGGVDVALRF